MAQPASFDITSTVDLQEVDNAVNQARKEVAQRYDFKGSRAAIDLNRGDNTLTLTADDEFKMNALWEILQTRMVRRGVPTKNLTPGPVERAANDTVRRVVRLVLLNEFKRRQSAPGPRVTTRAFGRERRYPITSGWR